MLHGHMKKLVKLDFVNNLIVFASHIEIYEYINFSIYMSLKFYELLFIYFWIRKIYELYYLIVYI